MRNFRCETCSINYGKSGLIHCHEIQNAVQLDGKSRRRNTNFQTVAKKSDEICRKYGLSVLDNYKEHIKENGERITFIDTTERQHKSHHCINKRNEQTDYESLQEKINHIKKTATNNPLNPDSDLGGQCNLRVFLYQKVKQIKKRDLTVSMRSSHP